MPSALACSRKRFRAYALGLISSIIISVATTPCPADDAEKDRGPLLTFDLKDRSLPEVLADIGRQAGVEIELQGEIEGDPLNLSVRGMRLDDVLDMLADALALQWRREGDAYVVEPLPPGTKRIRLATTFVQIDEAALDGLGIEWLLPLTDETELTENRIAGLVESRERLERQLDELQEQALAQIWERSSTKNDGSTHRRFVQVDKDWGLSLRPGQPCVLVSLRLEATTRIKGEDMVVFLPITAEVSYALRTPPELATPGGITDCEATLSLDSFAVSAWSTAVLRLPSLQEHHELLLVLTPEIVVVGQ